MTIRHSLLSFLGAVAAGGILLLSATSCNKEGSRLFEGYYSYKLSGSITLTEASPSEGEEATVRDLNIISESGQMNILTRNSSTGEMVVTMRPVSSSVSVFEATANGSAIEIDPAVKHFTVRLSGSSYSSSSSGSDGISCDVTIGGSGERIDDVLILTFTASGQTTYLDTLYNVTGSDIKCVGQLND